MDNSSQVPAEEPKAPDPQQAMPAADVPNTVGPNKPHWSRLKKILLFTGISVLVIILGVAAISAYFVFEIIHGFQSSIGKCSQGRTELYSQTQAITDEFNSLQLVPNQSSVKSTVSKQDGDCIDSLPTLYLSKQYVVTTTAGDAYDELTHVLAKNGYTPVREDTNLHPCTYKDQYETYTKGDRQLSILLTCANNTADSVAWRQIAVTRVYARLEVAWSYK